MNNIVILITQSGTYTQFFGADNVKKPTKTTANNNN